jgi:hypothetical protein
MVRLARPRAPARKVRAVLIRTPSIRFIGAGPAPTAPGRLWSAIIGCPIEAAASIAAACTGASS